jgi:hypothetical protein
MKKLAVMFLFVILALNQSQAKTTSVERVFISHKLSALKTQTATKSVLAYAAPRAQRRLLAIDDTDDGPPGPEELDLQTPFRRPRLVDNPQDSVSDYVAVRLALARAKALQKYNEKYSFSQI